ncbi:unnamed protein product, partial [Prorocentrum cordatum]
TMRFRAFDELCNRVLFLRLSGQSPPMLVYRAKPANNGAVLLLFPGAAHIDVCPAELPLAEGPAGGGGPSPAVPPQTGPARQGAKDAIEQRLAEVQRNLSTARDPSEIARLSQAAAVLIQDR